MHNAHSHTHTHIEIEKDERNSQLEHTYNSKVRRLWMKNNIKEGERMAQNGYSW